MTNSIRNQKDSLAKLMATENLTIVHKKVPTAYFDLENRILCCPILKDEISPELYDLFMGHEVSHALNTPYEGVHSAVTKNRTLKGYLNVVEDVRIEKMIKNKYQGLRKSFYKAYNELMDMDFFGIKDRNLQELSLIDKINLITKCGSRIQIKLTQEEQEFLDWSNRCQTWEEVVECATAIYEWSKENETRTEDDLKMVPQMFDIGDEEEDEDGDESEEFDNDFGDSDEDYEDEDNLPEIGDSENSEDGEEKEEGEEESEEETEEEGKSQRKMTGGKEASSGEYDDEDGARESITEHNAHNNEGQLYSEENIIKISVDLKDKYTKENDMMRSVKVSYKDLLKDMRESFFKDSNAQNKEVALHTMNKLEAKNKKIVNHMVKEFEMKQSAKRAVHAFSGKTGKLDMNALAKYQIVDDIFKRVTYLPEGENHGVNVMIDWSGSIHDEVLDLIEQALVLTMFCRKANIPHRVYLFSDNYERDEDGYRRDNGQLLELFSDKQNTREYKEMFMYISQIWNDYFADRLSGYGRKFEKSVAIWNDWFEGTHYVQEYDGYYIYLPRYSVPQRFGLGGTPLDHTLFSMRTLLRDFQKEYGIEKSILTVITDGYSHGSDVLQRTEETNAQIKEQTNEEMDTWNVDQHIEIIDPYSRRVYPISTGRYYRGGDFKRTQNILDWISKETGVIVTGYFVVGKKQDFVQIYSEVKKTEYYSDYKTEWLQCRKTGMVVNCHGYNKLFITSASSIGTEGTDELDEELVDAKKVRVLAAFKRNQKSKTTSRFLTNEFIKEIA
jgi:hypothetical protein